MKFITCVVARENRSLFSRGQERWSRLDRVDGFLAQTGGWCRGDENLAVIVALWDSAAAYKRFMRDVHDDIFASSQQEGVYSKITVSLFDEVTARSGAKSFVHGWMLSGKFLRVADCQVRRDRVAQFIDSQETAWSKESDRTPGLSGRVVGRAHEEEHELRYLVLSLSESEETSGRYQASSSPVPCTNADSGEACSSIDRTEVKVEPSWLVVSA